MTKVTITVYHYSEEFDHEDMGFDDDEWEALSEEQRQEEIETYCQTLFEENAQYYTEIKD